MNLHLMAPIGYTGYGYASLNILQSLIEENNVGLTPIGNPNPETQAQADLLSHAVNLKDMIPYDAACLKIWHQFDLLSRVGKGKYFTFPFFEVDKFNPKELHHLEFSDEIIVASSWAKKVLQENDIEKPIHIVPMGVDTKIFDHSRETKETANYIFLSIGNWEKRKAHDTMIQCFNQAFEQEDNVELWLATHNPFLNKEEENQWLSLVENSKLRTKIKVFPRLPSHESIAELISLSDCGVYISRGEGWNLELLETMAMNKPVIASNFSAHTEYCNKNNSFLVDITETEIAMDNKWFFGNSSWAKIDQDQIDQTIQHMRHCYENQIKTNENGLETAKQLTWKNCSNKIIQAISHKSADTLL